MAARLLLPVPSQQRKQQQQQWRQGGRWPVCHRLSAGLVVLLAVLTVLVSQQTGVQAAFLGVNRLHAMLAVSPSAPKGVVCDDGVCRLESTAPLESKVLEEWNQYSQPPASALPPEPEPKPEPEPEPEPEQESESEQEQEQEQESEPDPVEEVMKLGWSREEATEALQRSSGDVMAALSDLEERDAASQTVLPPPAAVAVPAPAPVAVAAAAPAPKPQPKATAPPVKKEDVIFEVTPDNLFQRVLNSKKPVILDVYADWCGPCKALTPVLEKFCLQTNGMFVLAKVNVDKQREIVDLLNVNSFPTVFALNQGRITDKFTGLIPTPKLQKFMERAITGFGKQYSDLPFSEFAAISRRLLSFAGETALTPVKRNRLVSKLKECLASEEAWDKTAVDQPSAGVQSALKYLRKAEADIGNPKYRSISPQNKVFSETVAPCAPATELLRLAGFALQPVTSAKAKRASRSSSDQVIDSSNDQQVLVLRHNNPAVLKLVLKQVDEVGKFRKVKQDLQKLQTQPQSAVKSASMPASRSKRPPSSSLPKETKTESKTKVVEAKPETEKSKIESKPQASSPAKLPSIPLRKFQPKKSTNKPDPEPKAKGKGKPKANTLFSTGIRSNQEAKHTDRNQYFGGDSTLTEG